MPANEISMKANRAHCLFALIAGLIGLFIIASWVFNGLIVKEDALHWKPMQFNAALSIVLSAIAVFLLNTHPVISRWCALVVLLISALTILEYLFNRDLGIDHLFINHQLMQYDTEHPGRMAPNTSVCFILICLAILLHSKPQTSFIKFTQLTLAILVLGLAAIVLVGYFLGISFAYGWSAFTAMAIYTASAFVALSLSLIIYFFYQHKAFYYKHGVVQTMSIIVIGCLFFVLLWQMLVANYLMQIQKNSKENVTAIMTQIQLAVQENYLASQRFLNRLANPLLSDEYIAKDADAYLKDMPGILLIEWGFPERQKLTRMRPTEMLNQSTLTQSCQSGFLKNNIKTDILTIPGAADHAYLCLYTTNIRTAMILFDLQKTIQLAIKESQLTNYGLIITFQNNLIFKKISHASTNYLKQWSLTEQLQFDFLDAPITVKTWPSPSYIESFIPWFPSFFFWLGIISILLLAYANHLKQKLLAHNVELQSSLSFKSNRLVEVESKYQRIYDFSPDLFLFVDTHNIILECNETFVDTMGFFRKKSIIGHKLFDILKIQDTTKKATISGCLAKSGHLSNLELNLITQDDNVCFMMLKINPFVDHNQRLIGYLFSFRDISDLRKLEKELASREYSMNLFKENKALYDLVLNETTDGWWDVNLETRECYLSPQLLISLGFDGHYKAPFMFIRDNVYPEDWPILENNMKKHLLSQGKFPFKQVIRYKHRNGQLLWIYCRGQGIVDPDGRIRRIVGTHVDITPLKLTQAKLSKKVRELDLIAQVTHLIAISQDNESLFNQCLSLIATATSFNYAICYRINENSNIMSAYTLWTKQSGTEALDEGRIIYGEGLVGQCWMDDKLHWVSDQKTIPNHQWPKNGFKSSIVFPVNVFDKVNTILQFFSSEKSLIDTDDVSMFELLAGQMGLAFEKMKTHYLLQQLALHDELTTLPNRRACIEMLELTMSRAERMNSRFGLMFLDLDGFKWVNDHMGHHIGDLLLIEVSKLFKSCLRNEDYLARLGGDEFLVIISDITSDEVLENMAQKLVDILAKPLILDNNSASVSVSIGIATYPESGKTVEQLLKLADHAMYQVKQHGKNSYHTI